MKLHAKRFRITTTHGTVVNSITRLSLDGRIEGAGSFHHGGRTPADLDALEWAVEAERLEQEKYFSPAWTVMHTQWIRPGTHAAISSAVRIPVIASGGAELSSTFMKH